MSLNVLLVDDDEIFIMLSTKLMARTGFSANPLSFEDGKRALDYFEQHYEANEYYAIFLDINMPALNGWEFLSEIKNFAKPDNTFVIMVSSSTDQADIDAAFKNDFVIQFLSKPLMPEKLLMLQAIPQLAPFYKTA